MKLLKASHIQKNPKRKVYVEMALSDLVKKVNRIQPNYVEKPDDVEFQKVEKDLLENGLTFPIEIRKSDGEVLQGKQRCQFAKKYGYTHISAYLL